VPDINGPSEKAAMAAADTNFLFMLRLLWVR
jgi:hypothetical protein